MRSSYLPVGLIRTCLSVLSVRVKVFECVLAQTQLHASPPHAPAPARQAAMERATPLPKGRTVLRPRGRAPAGEGVEGEYLSAVRRPCMPPPPPLTVLSAWEGCAPGAQRARAAAPRVQEQAGQYGLHAAAVQCRPPSGMRCADSRSSQGSGCVGLCAGPQGRRRRSPRSAVPLGTPST
jgi:hypothetical protein